MRLNPYSNFVCRGYTELLDTDRCRLILQVCKWTSDLQKSFDKHSGRIESCCDVAIFNQMLYRDSAVRA